VRKLLVISALAWLTGVIYVPCSWRSIPALRPLINYACPSSQDGHVRPCVCWTTLDVFHK
jgi:hypothetical protein